MTVIKLEKVVSILYHFPYIKGRAKDKNNIETSCSSTDEDVDEDIIINNDNNNNNNKDNSNAKNANLKVLIKKKPESPKAHQGCRCRKVSKDRVSSGRIEVLHSGFAYFYAQICYFYTRNLYIV